MRAVSLVVALSACLLPETIARSMAQNMKNRLKALFLPNDNKIILLGDHAENKIHHDLLPRFPKHERQSQILLEKMSTVADKALNMLRGKRRRRRTMTAPLPPTPTIPSQPAHVPAAPPQPLHAEQPVPVPTTPPPSPQEHCKDYCDKKQNEAKIDEIASILKDVKNKAAADVEKEKHKAEIKKEIEEALKNALQSMASKPEHPKEVQPHATPLDVKRLENEIKQLHEALKDPKIPVHCSWPCVPADSSTKNQKGALPSIATPAHDPNLGSSNPIMKLEDQSAALKNLCKSVV